MSKLSIALIITSLLLIGCGNNEEVESSANENVDLSDYPIGVQNSTVSLEYYELLNEARIKYDELHADIDVANKNNDNDESAKQVYRNYLVYLNGIKKPNMNDAELEIDKYFSSFIYNMEMNSEYRIKHIDSQSSLDNSLAKDYYDDGKYDLLMMFEVMNKYQLFYE